MRLFRRKTAPGVRNGRTCWKNNWQRTPNCYGVPQPIPAIDRRRPGRGHRHLLLKRDVERFVTLIPNWAEASTGLDVIVLDCARPNCDGWYNGGVIGICAWPIDMTFEPDWGWYRAHRDFLARIGARVEGSTPDDLTIRWTPSTARAYQLCHVFLHELGHHRDRMTTRSKKDNAPRGEQFAEKYAWEFEPRIWEAYLEEFGLPE